jgi:RNA polymerase sigma factor (sigma-70 family)
MHRRRIDDSHLELVRRVARRVYYRCAGKVELDELIGDGCEAIVKAAEGWNPDRDTPFDVHLATRARFAMIDGLRRRLGRSEHVRDLRKTVSLNAPARADKPDDATLGDLIEDPAADVQQHVEARIALADMIALPTREREAMIRRAAGETHAEVAEHLGISDARASQIEQRARSRMEGAPSSRPGSMRPVSPNELRVLECAALGMTTAATAAALNKSPETVKSQRRHLIRKLKAADITNAVYLATRAGLLGHLRPAA